MASGFLPAKLSGTVRKRSLPPCNLEIVSTCGEAGSGHLLSSLRQPAICRAKSYIKYKMSGERDLTLLNRSEYGPMTNARLSAATIILISASCVVWGTVVTDWRLAGVSAVVAVFGLVIYPYSTRAS